MTSLLVPAVLKAGCRGIESMVSDFVHTMIVSLSTILRNDMLVRTLSYGTFPMLRGTQCRLLDYSDMPSSPTQRSRQHSCTLVSHALILASAVGVAVLQEPSHCPSIPGCAPYRIIFLSFAKISFKGVQQMQGQGM